MLINRMRILRIKSCYGEKITKSVMPVSIQKKNENQMFDYVFKATKIETLNKKK